MQESMLAGDRIAPWSHRPAFAPLSPCRAFLTALIGVVGTLGPASAGEPAASSREEPSGTLVIVGGGLLPDNVRDHFLRLAGGKNGRLVVIPTASELIDRDHSRIERCYNYWREQGLASVSMLHTCDPKQADDPAFVKPLREATAAWLGGGDQSRLASIYRGTAVEKELRRLLARGGVVGGTSAGASVMSSVMITGGNPQARVGRGFGLVPDVVIDQHFQNRKREKRLLSVLEKHPDCLGLGIDEQTAVVLRGHSFRVVGNANVAVCLPPGDREPAAVLKVFRSGEVGDLLELGRGLQARLRPPVPGKPVAHETRSTP